MARINSNIASLIARGNLQRAKQNLDVRLQRLATGLRINRGSDDPAGLIVSERLRSELNAMDQGIRNSERAQGVLSTTEASLAEVSDLLNSMKALVVGAANSGAISQEEIEANQLQLDSAIESITRISNTASFAGLKLLDGSLGYSLSGVNQSLIGKTEVFAANFGTRSNIQVDVEVVGSAQQAQLFARTDFSNVVAGATDGVLVSGITLEIAGPDGVQVIAFGSGTSTDDMVAAVNALSDSTGVKAERINAASIASGIRFFSTTYGTDAFVSVTRLGNSGQFFGTAQLPNNAAPSTLDFTSAATFNSATRDLGKDVVALVNGALARGRGTELSIRNGTLEMQVLLVDSFATVVSATPTTFHVTGGGSLYQLGPSVQPSQQVNIGIQSIAASRLGGTFIASSATASPELQFLESLKSGGKNSLFTKNFAVSSKIVSTAIDEISSLRGRLGAFERNTVEPNIRSLQSAVENVSAAESVIRDADFASEITELNRAQILTSTATSILATSNAQAQSVLQLLG